MWKKRWDTGILGSSLNKELSCLAMCSWWLCLETTWGQKSCWTAQRWWRSLEREQGLRTDLPSPHAQVRPQGQIALSMSCLNGGVWRNRELHTGQNNIIILEELIAKLFTGPSKEPQERVFRTEDGAPPVPFVELPQPAHLAVMWRQSLRNVACWEE